MGVNWTGGIVDQRDGDGPPTVEEWRSVAEPGRRTAFSDATEPIAYRAEFADPRSDEAERGWLELRADPSVTAVWLNDERIDVPAHPFVPIRTTFAPRSENELTVVCAPSDSADGTGISEGFEDIPDVGTVARRWRVDVESRPQVFLRDLTARPRRTDDGGAIDVEVTVDAGESFDDTVTLSVRPEGFRGGATMQRVSVDAGSGECEAVSDSLEVRDPSLWWPRGYGPQHRYAVRAKLNGTTISRAVGFRTVERDSDGLVVNGQRVRLRGFTRLPGGEPARDVERAAAANANLVRAHGHVPPQSFYDACDEAGMFVWQDLPASGLEADEDDAGGEAVTSLEDAFGHHPSLAMYGVPESVSSPVDGLHGSGTLSKLRFRYRLWRATGDHGVPDAVADAVPDHRPLVSSTGPPGTGADATTLYPGWRYLEATDVEWILERYPSLGTIVGGFGAGSLASDDVDPADVPGLDASILERRLEDVSAGRSQSYQTRTVKTVAEALRRHESTALVATTLRDPSPGGGMGVLTRDGEEKSAYRALARSFEPVQAVLDEPPEPGSVGITLCNETAREIDATVAWEAGEIGGQTTVEAGPLETTPAGTAEISDDASRIELTVEFADRTVTNRYNL